MNPPIDDDIPAEIDFRKGTRGLHHIPARATTLMPASIEVGVWRYFSGKAEARGVPLSQLLTNQETELVQRGMVVSLVTTESTTVPIHSIAKMLASHAKRDNDVLGHSCACS